MSGPGRNCEEANSTVGRGLTRSKAKLSDLRAEKGADDTRGVELPQDPQASGPLVCLWAAPLGGFGNQSPAVPSPSPTRCFLAWEKAVVQRTLSPQPSRFL